MKKKNNPNLTQSQSQSPTTMLMRTLRNRVWIGTTWKGRLLLLTGKREKEMMWMMKSTFALKGEEAEEEPKGGAQHLLLLGGKQRL